MEEKIIKILKENGLSGEPEWFKEAGKDILSLFDVVGQSEQLKPFHCPNCKQPWDTRLTNSCQCGASIKSF